MVLPSAAPLTVPGIRINAGSAILRAIVAEQLVGLIGLAEMIPRLGGAFAVAELYPAIAFIGIVDVVTLALLGPLEKRVVVN